MRYERHSGGPGPDGPLPLPADPPPSDIEAIHAELREFVAPWLPPIAYAVPERESIEAFRHRFLERSLRRDAFWFRSPYAALMMEEANGPFVRMLFDGGAGGEGDRHEGAAVGADLRERFERFQEDWIDITPAGWVSKMMAQGEDGRRAVRLRIQGEMERFRDAVGAGDAAARAGKIRSRAEGLIFGAVEHFDDDGYALGGLVALIGAMDAWADAPLDAGGSASRAAEAAFDAVWTQAETLRGTAIGREEERQRSWLADVSLSLPGGRTHVVNASDLRRYRWIISANANPQDIAEDLRKKTAGLMLFALDREAWEGSGYDGARIDSRMRSIQFWGERFLYRLGRAKTGREMQRLLHEEMEPFVNRVGRMSAFDEEILILETLRQTFEDLPAHARGPATDFITAVEGWSALYDMAAISEAISEVLGMDAAVFNQPPARSTLQAATEAERAVREKTEQLGNALMELHKGIVREWGQHCFLSQLGSATRERLFGGGDLVDIADATKEIRGLQARLLEARTMPEVARALEGIYRALKEGGALDRALEAAHMDGAESLVHAAQIAAEALALALVAGGGGAAAALRGGAAQGAALGLGANAWRMALSNVRLMAVDEAVEALRIEGDGGRTAIGVATDLAGTAVAGAVMSPLAFVARGLAPTAFKGGIGAMATGAVRMLAHASVDTAQEAAEEVIEHIVGDIAAGRRPALTTVELSNTLLSVVFGGQVHKGIQNSADAIAAGAAALAGGRPPAVAERAGPIIGLWLRPPQERLRIVNDRIAAIHASPDAAGRAAAIDEVVSFLRALLLFRAGIEEAELRAPMDALLRLKGEMTPDQRRALLRLIVQEYHDELPAHYNFFLLSFFGLADEGRIAAIERAALEHRRRIDEWLGSPSRGVSALTMIRSGLEEALSAAGEEGWSPDQKEAFARLVLDHGRFQYKEVIASLGVALLSLERAGWGPERRREFLTGLAWGHQASAAMAFRLLPLFVHLSAQEGDGRALSLFVETIGRLAHSNWEPIMRELEMRSPLLVEMAPEETGQLLGLFSEAVSRWPRRGLGILEGLISSRERGILRFADLEHRRGGILDFIDRSHGFNPVLWAEYSARGEALFQELDGYRERILADEMGVEELMAIAAGKGKGGLAFLLAVIQRTSPASGASFVPASAQRDLLEEMMEAGDLRAHIPAAWRGRRERFEIAMGEWRLPEGEVLDADGHLGEVLGHLRAGAGEKGDAGAEQKRLEGALVEYVGARGDAAEAAVVRERALSALFRVAGRRDDIREGLAEIGDLDYSSLIILEQLFKDRAGIRKVLSDALAGIGDEAFSGRGGKQGLKSVENVVRYLNGIWSNVGETEEKRLEGIANVLSSFERAEVEAKILGDSGLSLAAGLREALARVEPRARDLRRNRLVDELLKGPLRRIAAEKARYVHEDTGRFSMGLRAVKGPAFGLFGLTAGVCTASDVGMWRQASFKLFAITNETEGEVVGYVQAVGIEDRGKRYLTLPGINPSAEFLGRVRGAGLYDGIIGAITSFAEAGGYDGVYIPTAPHIHSNRGDILRAIARKRYPRVTLEEAVRWDRLEDASSPHDFHEVYEVWRR